MQDTHNRRSTAVLITGLVLLVGISSWALLQPVSQPKRSDVPIPIPVVKPAVSVRTVDPVVVSDRLPVDGATITIVIVVIDGARIDAVISVGGKLVRVNGSGSLPANAGEAAVVAAGYKSVSVHVANEDLTINMIAISSLKGEVLDACTRMPIDVILKLRRAEGGDAIAIRETGADGRFDFASVEAGDYVIGCGSRIEWPGRLLPKERRATRGIPHHIVDK